MSDHDGHTVVPFAEAHDTEQPRVHAGIGWCRDCETEVAHTPPARVI